MSARSIAAALLVLAGLFAGILPDASPRAAAQTTPPAPPPPPGEPAPAQPSGVPAQPSGGDVTPARVSYLDGEVSFWREGAQDWAPASLNMPLAPGDVVYAGANGTVEIQVAPAVFARATYNTQIGIDDQEPDFVQLRITGGQSALDVRRLTPGFTVEVDTPSAALTVDRAGYYRIDVGQDAVSFATHRGGVATVTPVGGAASPVAADQQIVLTGIDSPQVALGAAPPLSAWDNWNYQRTDYVIQPASSRYMSQGVYGSEALDRYGSWRTVETYGSVWVPSGVAPGWVPYSTGRWVWDPRFGWTWLDEAPWGWAPYHYGRWVFVSNYWAWAPGPIIVRPVYSPALVVFLGGPTVVRPLCWAPLAWGEPLIPWWGRPGFIGVPSWRGWGGPRVVNNVVVNRTTTVNVTNISIYKNVNVNKAVVGVPADRFGHAGIRPIHISQAELAELRPVHGALEAKPVPASLTPATGPAVKPPAAMRDRTVVATRRPPDVAPSLRAHGLSPSETPSAPRLVPAPHPSPRPEVVDRPHPPQSGREAKPPAQPRPERGAERPRPPGQPVPGPSVGAPGPTRGKVAEPPGPPPPGPTHGGRRPTIVERPDAGSSREPARPDSHQERRPAPNVERPTPMPPPTGGPKDAKPQGPGAANQNRVPEHRGVQPQRQNPPPAVAREPRERGESRARPERHESPRADNQISRAER